MDEISREVCRHGTPVELGCAGCGTDDMTSLEEDHSELARQLDAALARAEAAEASLGVAQGAAVLVRAEAEKQHARAEVAEAEVARLRVLVSQLYAAWEDGYDLSGDEIEDAHRAMDNEPLAGDSVTRRRGHDTKHDTPEPPACG